MIAPPTSPSIVESDQDSDSDWDDDDDFGSKKINIKIKPITQVTPNKISASVDELRATVETWKSMANINLVKPRSRRHHLSTVQLNRNGNNLQNGISPTLESSASSVSLAPREFDIPRALSEVVTLKPSNLRDDFVFSSTTTNGKHGHTTSIGLDYNELTNHILENNNSLTIKPNGRSTIPPTVDLLDRTLLNSIVSKPNSSSCFEDSSLIFSNSFEAPRVPIALAIQETINAKLAKRIGSPGCTTVTISLFGRLKMAVPTNFLALDSISFNECLNLELLSDLKLEKVNYNQELCHQLPKSNQVNSLLLRKFQVDMKAVQKQIKLLDKATNLNYILLPELLTYATSFEESRNSLTEMNYINPLVVLHSCLCQNNVIKLRLDLSINQDSGITSDQVKNVKITLHIDGDVSSCESKPQAVWNELDSSMTWSFNSLSELIWICRSSENKGSCLARFLLNNELSVVKDVDIHFTLCNKTISGSRALLSKSESYSIVKQKLETRAGIFKCEMY